MDPSSNLAVIAEVAITLAGFSGIVAVFRSRDGFLAEELRRILFILAVCFLMTITSLLPGALAGLGLAETAALQISSLVLGVGAALLVANSIYRLAQGTLHLNYPWVSFVVLAIATATGASQILGAFRIVFAPSVGFLLLGELALLVLAGWSFVSTVIWAQRSENE